MATLSEISAANQYGGNAAIGGAAQAAVNLDARPLESLAHYVFFYNRNLHEEKRKDADDRAMELAELAKFNPDAALPQDKKAALEAWNQIVTFGGDYARKPLTGSGQDKLQQQWEFKTKINGTLRLIDKINKRAVSYNTQKAQLDARTDITEAQKADFLKELDKLANTDTTVDIPTLPAFDMKIPNVGDATLDKLEVSTDLGNKIITTPLEVFNFKKELGRSEADAMGFNNLFVSPDSEQYKTASEGQRRQYDFAAKSNNDFRFWKEAENVFAAAMDDPKYKKDGKIDFDLIASANPMLGNIFGVIDKYNAWAKDMTAQATRGVFVDHLNKRDLRVLNPIPVDSWPTIDKEKPLTSAQIITLQKWAKSPKLLVKEEDIKQTNESLGYAELAERRRHNKAEEAKGTATTVSSDYLPFQSIVASVGALNKQVPLSTLSAAQVGAISPSLLNEKGQLDESYQTLKVSVGKRANGEFGIYLYDPTGKHAAQVKRKTAIVDGVPVVLDENAPPQYFSPDPITPSTVLSNASSWLSTFGKELKTQDAYRFEPNAFINTFNVNLLSGKAKQTDLIYDVNGKTYGLKDLTDMGYTKEQIEQAIQLGNIKIKK